MVLRESAQLDYGGRPRIFWRILVHLSKFFYPLLERGWIFAFAW